MKRTVCLVIIFLLAQVLSSLVVLFFFNLSDLLHEGRLDVNALATSPSALGISLLLNGAVVWAVMTLLRWTDRKSFRFGQIKWPVYVGVVLWMLPVIFIVNLLLETLTLEDLNKDVFATLVYNPWGVLAIVLVGPVTEELVFRMGIQRHLIRHRMRPWMAILLSALIFGAVHGNPAQIPGAVVFGWVAMIWCTEDTDTTLVELCGGAVAASVWALAAAVCGYVGYRYLDKVLEGKGIGRG